MEEVFPVKIADLQKENQELRIKNEQLKRFIEIGKILSLERDIDQLLPLLMTEISKSLDADRSSVFLIDWEHMDLWSKYAESLESDRIHIQLKMGIIGLCVLTGQLINVTNAYEDPRFNSEIDEVTGFRTDSVLCAPFFGKGGKVIGAIELLSKRTGFFREKDEQKTLKTTSMLTEMALANGFDKDKAKKLVYELRQSTGCERGTLFLLDWVKGELLSIMAENLEAQDIRLRLNLGIAGLVAITGQELNIKDAYADPRFDKSTDERTGYRTRCILCMPIKNQSGDIIGVIEAINKKEGSFNDSEIDLLKALSPIIAISIENALLLQEHQQQFKSLLEVLAASIDAKDPLTAGHSEKVAKYAVGIAREFGLGKSEIDVLTVAALLHDYGKLGTDDNVLKKPGKLTSDEHDHIRQHVVKTRDLLNKMNFMRKYRQVPLIASSHHERLDGSGYIDGLKSHQTPFMTKIIAVADVFDALTAPRHYREALSPKDAFKILEQDSGTKFDDNIVEAMKKSLLE
ncbi:HD domain-containing phosphohydrolase [Thermodesulfobacteriota bacterium]